MLDLGQNLLFSHDMLLLIFLDDIFLLQDLEGKKFLVFFAGNQTHFGVSAFPNNTVEVEIVHSNVIHLFVILNNFNDLITPKKIEEMVNLYQIRP